MDILKHRVLDGPLSRDRGILSDPIYRQREVGVSTDGPVVHFQHTGDPPEVKALYDQVEIRRSTARQTPRSGQAHGVIAGSCDFQIIHN